MRLVSDKVLKILPLLAITITVLGVVFIWNYPFSKNVNADEVTTEELQTLQDTAIQFKLCQGDWEIVDDVQMQVILIPGLQPDNEIWVDGEYDITYKCFKDAVVFIAYDEIPEHDVIFRVSPGKSW